MTKHRRTYLEPEWRFDELIDFMKPYRRIVERLEERGYPTLPIASIATWRKVNRIPGIWVPAFLAMALDDGFIEKIDDMRIVKGDDWWKITSERQSPTSPAEPRS